MPPIQRAKSGEVAVEDRKFRQERQEADVERSGEQLFRRREGRGKIDRLALERVEVGRQESFGRGEEVEEFRVALEIEVGAAGIVGRRGARAKGEAVAGGVAAGAGSGGGAASGSLAAGAVGSGVAASSEASVMGLGLYAADWRQGRLWRLFAPKDKRCRAYDKRRLAVRHHLVPTMDAT